MTQQKAVKYKKNRYVAVQATLAAFQQQQAYLLLLSSSSFFFHNTTIPAAAAATAIPETLEFNQYAGGAILLSMPTILILLTCSATKPSPFQGWIGLRAFSVRSHFVFDFRHKTRLTYKESVKWKSPQIWGFSHRKTMRLQS